MAKGIFVGLSTIDVVYRVDGLPSANSKAVARSQDVFAGGPATNAAVAFSHLGGEATLVAAVGRHALAGFILDELRRHSIELYDLNSDFAEAPAISCVSVRETGERSVISANATRMPALRAQVDEAALEQASIVLVDGHSMQACQAWAGAARKRRIRVVFDGGSWKAGAGELLKNVDTAICSADFRPPDCSNEDDVLQYLQNCGVAHVAITMGSEPVRYLSDEMSGVVPAPPVAPVDTMGAGDIFHGAFCYFAATGRGFVEALGEAAKIAAESCRYSGTREWMRHTDPAKRSALRAFPLA